MARYTVKPEDGLIYETDIRKMFDVARNRMEQVLIAMEWITGARPAELLELEKENIKLETNDKNESFVIFLLPTKKTGTNTRFILKTRQLKFQRPQGDSQNLYLETIVDYINRLPSRGKLFPRTTRWMQKVFNRVSVIAINKRLAPYHCRHSAVTNEASKGRTPDQLMHFKGAKSLKSVMPYLHARPYDISVNDSHSMVESKQIEGLQAPIKNQMEAPKEIKPMCRTCGHALSAHMNGKCYYPNCTCKL